MGDDKKKIIPKKQFFKNPQWWLTFALLNIGLALLKFKFLPEATFTLVFDVLIGIALILMLVELSHDNNFGDRFFDTMILTILIWLLISISDLPTKWNFLIP